VPLVACHAATCTVPSFALRPSCAERKRKPYVLAGRCCAIGYVDGNRLRSTTVSYRCTLTDIRVFKYPWMMCTLLVTLCGVEAGRRLENALDCLRQSAHDGDHIKLP
jgi:hypothetical protein